MTSALIQLLFPVTSDDVACGLLKVWFSTKDYFPPVVSFLSSSLTIFFSLLLLLLCRRSFDDDAF